MKKVPYLIFVFFLLCTGHYCLSQPAHRLQVQPVDKDSSFIKNIWPLQTTFATQEECRVYIQWLIPAMQAKGYIAASIDSVIADSAKTMIHLYTGPQYSWKNITTDSASRQWLVLAGWQEDALNRHALNLADAHRLLQQLLHYFETHGYPFATLFFDSIQLQQQQVSGVLKVVPGPLYRIDSISVVGNAKVNNDYLQRVLNITNGSVYNKEKIQQITTALQSLQYIEQTLPPRLYWHSTGGHIELYLKQKRNNQVHFIVGFLPNNSQLASNKMLITGEALLHLNNTLGSGETIHFNWQRLQVQSQRLQLLYRQPYLLRTPLGFDFSFDMFKKDSSFLNFDFRLGGRYTLQSRQWVSLFFQQLGSIVSAINASSIIQNKKLPEDADMRVTQVGIEYNVNTTYPVYNPASGLALQFTTATGTKKLKRNSQVMELKDANDPLFNFATLYDTVKLHTYQLRIVLAVAQYMPLSRSQRSVVKVGVNGGYLHSGRIYRNDLFQIGGYNLLRGFDEQSQYLSQYAIGTAEYRYLVGASSYFNAFADVGWGRNALPEVNKNYTYVGAGLGMAFETKAGVFNLAWAVGKRNDTPFNVRQSKIHFGFINYF